jgi:DNA-binding MarR family transcriptional regulator
MDYSRRSAGAAIGARLRRLSEQMDGDTGRIYATLGVRFEQRWFGVLNQLAVNGPMSVGELAAALGITHVSVSQTRRSLEAAGLIAATADTKDARRKLLTPTDAAQALIAQLAPLWKAFEAAALELDAEAGGAVAMLDRLDDALGRRSLYQRITERLDQPKS